MTLNENCCTANCEQAAAVLLATRPLCVPHFISTSYERIDEYLRAVTEQRFQETFAEETWQFVVDCIARSADLTQCAEKLDNLTRARLLDILLRAAELSRYLRRSPRRRAAVPLQLRCEKLGRAWEEKVHTHTLSRFGAMLDCENHVEAGDSLHLTRLDTGSQIRARVAWSKKSESGRTEIGIELLNCENYWDLEWGGAEGYRPAPNWTQGRLQ
jgi:hypothetical protein